MKHFALHQVKTVAVLWRTDNGTLRFCSPLPPTHPHHAPLHFVGHLVFSYTTCLAAIQNAADGNMRVIHKETYTTEDATKPEIIKPIIDRAGRSGADVLIACAFAPDGLLMLSRISELKIKFKAIFLTIGPTQQSFISSAGITAKYVFSAGQWHPAMSSSDEIFGSGADYIAGLKSALGIMGNHVAAGSSALIEVLMVAIQKAFQYDVVDTPATLLSNPSNYDKIRVALMKIQTSTFYGKVEFNKWRRNIAKSPATIQLLSDSSGLLQQRCVMPAELSDTLPVFPTPGSAQCAEGSVPNADITVCTQCPLNTFSWNPSNFSCDPCPASANCRGASVVVPQTNFWHSGPRSVQMHKCPIKDACNYAKRTEVLWKLQDTNSFLGFFASRANITTTRLSTDNHTTAVQAYMSAQCAPGYAGYLCARCAPGYGKADGRCQECPPRLTKYVYCFV
jgi:hypothetical protein